MTEALILAAGTGSRLGALLNGKPKGLLSIGGRTLIEHQVTSLRACGVLRIGVVVGYGAHYVREAIGDAVEYIENERYASTNSLYSLWTARKWVKSEFMMVNSDLFADARIYERVAEAAGSGLAYDSTSGSNPEEMKVSLRHRRVVRLSKSMDPRDSSGESIGLLKFDGAAAARLFEAADQMVSRGALMEWAPAAVSAIAPVVRIDAIDIADMPWTEIDFPEDFDHAARDVWQRMKIRAEGHSHANGAIHVDSRAKDHGRVGNGAVRGRQT